MPHKAPKLFLATLAVCACDDRTDSRITELTIDTLANGSVLVSNPLHGPWDSNPGTRWRLVETLRIGNATGGGPDAFGNVISLTLDALDRLWIVDSQANEVRVFDRDGRFVRTIGGRGEGPAEFIGARGVSHGPNGEIWVEDGRLKRWILGPNLDIRWSDGLDRGGRYELRRIDLESGRTPHTVLRQYEPVAISEAARVAAVEAEVDPVRGGHNLPGAPRPPPEAMDLVPRVYPPFEDFHLSRDGSPWVRRNLGDGVVGFDVFDGEGRNLGQPELPDGFANMSVRLITGDRMYVIDPDEMGVDYVVRLEIVRSP